MQSIRREPSLQGPVAREHGLWSASEIAALRGRALDEVVAPVSEPQRVIGSEHEPE